MLSNRNVSGSESLQGMAVTDMLPSSCREEAVLKLWSLAKTSRSLPTKLINDVSIVGPHEQPKRKT